MNAFLTRYLIAVVLGGSVAGGLYLASGNKDDTVENSTSTTNSTETSTQSSEQVLAINNGTNVDSSPVVADAPEIVMQPTVESVELQTPTEETAIDVVEQPEVQQIVAPEPVQENPVDNIDQTSSPVENATEIDQVNTTPQFGEQGENTEQVVAAVEEAPAEVEVIETEDPVPTQEVVVETTDDVSTEELLDSADDTVPEVNASTEETTVPVPSNEVDNSPEVVEAVVETDGGEIASAESEVPADEATPTETDQNQAQSNASEDQVATEGVQELTSDSLIIDVPQEQITPAFDVVRVDNMGSAVIAGTSAPNSTVSILADGEVIGEATASNSGEFVAMIETPETDQAQNINLETEIDGDLVFSNETILILPTIGVPSSEDTTETAAPTIIKTTEEDLVVIQPGGQLLVEQVTVDSISYDDEGELSLTGRGTPSNSVFVYVDGALMGEATISQSGLWKSTLVGLDAGQYMLRADEIDPVGKVSSRMEIPFQRAYPQDVGAPKPTEKSVTVQPGDSLWLIATGNYGLGEKYYQIFTANRDKIRDPDLIYPGQVFSVPADQN